MNFLSKIFKADKGGCQLALDIGTESAKALVFLSDKKEERVVIKGVGLKNHEAGDMQGGVVVNLEGVVKTCEKAIKTAETMARMKPSKAYVSIGGEYIKNLTENFNFTRQDEKIKISMSELQELVCKAQKKLFESSERKLKWNAFKLIGADVVDFSIDGYRVINPVNFKGGNIRITVSNSYVTKEHHDLVTEIVSKLGLSLSSISYGPYAVLKAIGAQDIMKFNAIFIDVGGGTTDVIAIRNRNIEDDKFFMYGGKAFTRGIAKALGNVELSIAEKMKIEYSENKISGDLREKIRNAIENDCSVWAMGVAMSLEELSRSNLLPANILLYGGGNHLSEVKKALERLLIENKYPFSDAPRISFINPSDIINCADETKTTNTLQFVTAISLANLSLDLANEEDFPNQIIKKCYLIDK